MSPAGPSAAPGAGPATCISTNCLPHLPLEVSLSWIAAAGFDGIELVSCPELWLRGPAEVGRMVRRHGLRIFSLHQAALGFCPVGRDPASLVHDAVETALIAHSACVVTHFPLWARPAAELDPWWVNALRAGRERLRGSGIALTVENQGTCTTPTDVERVGARLQQMVDFADREQLALTLDACHMGTAGHLLPQTLELFWPRLAHVHVSDFNPPETVPRGRRFHKATFEHLMPGDGALPLGPFLRELAARGYTGAVSAEVNPLALRVWSPAGVRRRLRRVVRYLRGQLTPRGARGQAPGRR